MAHELQISKYDSLLSIVKQRNGDGDEPQIKLWYGKGDRQYQSSGLDSSVCYAKN